MSIQLVHPGNEPAAPAVLALSRNWNAQVHTLVDRAVFFANQTRSPQDIHDAWRTFRVWLSSWIDYNSDDWRLFLVWYVFHWQPPGTESALSGKGFSIARQYADAFPGEITAAERQMLDVATGSPMDFYEVHDLPELNCIYVKSLFLGYQHSYAFKDLPEGLRVGDVFFGKIIQFHDDMGVIAGNSRPFPRTAKVAIGNLRRQLISGRKEEFIKNFPLFDTDLFNLYHDLMAKEAQAF